MDIKSLRLKEPRFPLLVSKFNKVCPIPMLETWKMILMVFGGYSLFELKILAG